MGVFRTLVKANHHPRLYEVADEVEQAVGDIQLFGTPEQVALVQRFAMELATHKSAEINCLLAQLRDNLRKELGEERVAGSVVRLRIVKNNEPTS